MELVFVFIWICCGILGALIGSRTQSGSAGFMVGVLFGPLGVIAAFALDNRERCPFCAGRLDGRPMVCRHCQRDLIWPEDEEDEGRGEYVIRCSNCNDELFSVGIESAGETTKCPICGEYATAELFEK